MWNDFWAWLATLPTGSASFIGTLTGSSLGLLAILAGALFNAHLNRKRDNDLRDAERIALASAIYAELQGLHRTLVENAQHLTEKPPHIDGGFVQPALTVKIMPEMLPEIGRLKSDTIHKVMDAYILCEQYLDKIILNGGTLQTNMPANRQLVFIPAGQTKNVVMLNEVTAGVVKEAIDALAPYLK